MEQTPLSEPKQQSSPQEYLFTLLRDVLETVIPAMVIALLITHFVGERTVVFSQSMEPNLHENQQLIVDKLSYHLRQPERGEIVVLEVEDSAIPYIKRVIGLPGETLEIRDNRVLIDGEVLSEPYLADVMQQNYGPIHIPEGHVFVMGDNRSYSRDSRVIGPIPIENVTSRAWITVWPPEDVGVLR